MDDLWPSYLLDGELAAALTGIRPTLRACEDEAEQLRLLPQPAVEA